MRWSRLIPAALLVALLPLTGCYRMAEVMTAMGQAYNARQAAEQSAGTTYFLDSQMVTGMTRQCFYSFGSTVQTKTVGAAELCPLTIKVR